MKISLVGYMGSGKTAIGKKLSDILGLNFLDLDEYITTQEQQNIDSIFQNKGELYFRKKESLYLKELLNQNNFVLSTGGGTPIFYNHMDVINQQSNSYYLFASPTTLSKRLAPEKKHRPLIAHISDENLPEFIAKHLFERNHFYRKAHHIIDTNGKSIEVIAKEIMTIQSRS